MIEEFKKILRLQSEASFILSNNHPRRDYGGGGEGGFLEKFQILAILMLFLQNMFTGIFTKKITGKLGFFHKG